MYRFITGLPAKSISYSPVRRKISDIKYIVVHFTGNDSDTAFANANYFNKWNNRKAGAHFFVDDNYVYQSIAPTKIAYAVGGGLLSGAKLAGKCTNKNSVSVELCSKNGKPTEETLENAEIFIRDLMCKYNIPSSRVVRHFDVTKKLCPGWIGWSGNDSSEWFKFKERFIAY